MEGRTEGRGRRPLKCGGAIFLTLFALPFVGGEVFGIFTLGVRLLS